MHLLFDGCTSNCTWPKNTATRALSLDIMKVTKRKKVPLCSEQSLEILSVHALSSFEDAIRNAISIGGVAEAYYGVPEEMRVQALGYLDDELLGIFMEFEKVYSKANRKKR